MQEYTDKVASLKTACESFIAKAEEGTTNKLKALEARQASMDLRAALKDFRKISVRNDKSRVNPRGPRAPRAPRAAAPAPAADAVAPAPVVAPEAAVAPAAV